MLSPLFSIFIPMISVSRICLSFPYPDLALVSRALGAKVMYEQFIQTASAVLLCVANSILFFLPLCH